MDVLSLIAVNVILPVFIIIGLGAFFHRIFHFEMNTLSKITTYFLLPAVGFVNIYQSQLFGELFIQIIGFLLIQSFCLILLSLLISKVAKLERGVSITFKNSVVLNNSGNYGIPVSQLVFQDHPIGLSIQLVVMIFQNLLTYTYGLLNSASAHTKGSKVLVEFLKLPMLYALILGITLNVLELKIPLYIWGPIDNIANAFLAIALLTLGAQVAYLKIKRITLPLILSIVGRLILSPMLAFIVIQVLGLEGVTAQALFIASSFPSSRNSALFALEYNNHPDYAAQAVLLSTLLSSITVTIVVFLSGKLF